MKQFLTSGVGVLGGGGRGGWAGLPLYLRPWSSLLLSVVQTRSHRWPAQRPVDRRIRDNNQQLRVFAIAIQMLLYLLYCTVLYCAVLCCTVLHCPVLCGTVLYCAELCCTVLHCAVLYCAALCHTVQYCAALHCIYYTSYAVCHITEQGSSQLLLLLLCSLTMHAVLQMSAGGPYPAPINTSRLRYCRVWISSVKWCC